MDLSLEELAKVALRAQHDHIYEKSLELLQIEFVKLQARSPPPCSRDTICRDPAGHSALVWMYLSGPSIRRSTSKQRASKSS